MGKIKGFEVMWASENRNVAVEPPKEEQFGKTELLKQEYYHAFCSRCGRPVIAKKEEAFWWPGGTTDDHLCISCDVCGGLAEV